MKKAYEKIEPYLYLLPSLALMAAIIIYPIIISFNYSLYDWSGLGPMKYVGFDNINKILSGQDTTFWKSILVTFEWVVLSVVVLSSTGLVLAFLVEYGTRTQRLVKTARTVLFMPMMMSMVSIGLLWTLIFNPLMGLLNKLLSVFGLMDMQHPLDLLGNYDLALFAAFIPVIWQWSGFGMVVFSAALQAVPEEIMEASVIDGASLLQRIRYISLPLLKPKIIMVSTVNLIGAFKCFDIIYVMTAGGPGNATQVTSIYLFREAFVNNNYGSGSAISVMLFLITLIFGVVFMLISSKSESYI